MAELVASCPRCRSDRITLDVYGDVFIDIEYNWQTHHEVVAVCRNCHRPSIYRVELTDVALKDGFRSDNSLRSYKGVLNDFFRNAGAVTQRDVAGRVAPEYLPDPIPRIFQEGTSSNAAACYNAAGAMFRLCLDLATKQFLPPQEDQAQPQPDRRQRCELAARLDWLFDQAKLPPDLRDLARCVREHGNDGAHDGTLTDVDAQDLEDFTVTMLERIYTEPGRVHAAQARRDARHKSRG